MLHPSSAEADGRSEIIQQHQDKTRQHGEPCAPTERIRPATLDYVRGLAVGHYFSEQEASHESADVGVIVDARHQYTQHRDISEPVDQLATQHAHANTVSSCGECEQQANQTKQRTRSSHAEVPCRGTQEITSHTRHNKDEEKASRSEERREGKA